MDNKQARYLHRMLDRLAEGKNLSPEEIALLRKELPELEIVDSLDTALRGAGGFGSTGVN